jgi:nifR3 family TIM-barrel protein
MTFWQRLPKPFFVLAPMANVTDSVFRRLFAKYGKPDVTWTEFVSADGLISPGRKNLLHDLEYSAKERPIVAQLFTGHPEVMKKAAALAKKLGFDGLDINMGCPDRSVEKQGGGAAHMRDPKTALKVIAAAREGFGGPVSVKTRIGYNRVEMDWIRTLLELRLPALTVHLRTRKEMSDVPAHWELMPEIVELRNQISPETLIIGNGDVESMEDAWAKVAKSGCDGAMIGRGIFGKPWFFEKKPKDRTPEERLKVMLEHAKLFEKTFCGKNGKRGLKNFAVMKKHFKAYVHGWDGAKELRVKLMETENAKEVDKIVKEYLKLNIAA